MTTFEPSDTPTDPEPHHAATEVLNTSIEVKQHARGLDDDAESSVPGTMVVRSAFHPRLDGLVTPQCPTDHLRDIDDVGILYYHGDGINLTWRSQENQRIQPPSTTTRFHPR